MKKGKNMRELPLENVVTTLNSAGIVARPLRLGYGFVNWYIRLVNHPIENVMYHAYTYKIILQSLPIHVEAYPTLRGLRKRFPKHQLQVVKSRVNDETILIIVLEANIKDIEKIDVLIDTLNAANYLASNIAK